jgi:hypothetical protein
MSCGAVARPLYLRPDRHFPGGAFNIRRGESIERIGVDVIAGFDCRRHMKSCLMRISPEFAEAMVTLDNASGAIRAASCSATFQVRGLPELMRPTYWIVDGRRLGCRSEPAQASVRVLFNILSCPLGHGVAAPDRHALYPTAEVSRQGKPPPLRSASCRDCGLDFRPSTHARCRATRRA